MDNTLQYSDIPEDLRVFLTSILTEAGIRVDQNTEEEVVKELFIQLDNYMLGTIVDELPADKLDEFTQMVESGKSREEQEKYLQDNIPNVNEKFAQSLAEFKQLYLGNVAVARNKPSENADAPAPLPPAPVDTENTNTQKVN